MFVLHACAHFNTELIRQMEKYDELLISVTQAKICHFHIKLNFRPMNPQLCLLYKTEKKKENSVFVLNIHTHTASTL